MLLIRRSIPAFALAGLFACVCTTINLYGQQSGQRVFANSSVEPAIDSTTGNTVYLLTPIKAPFPAKANTMATAPLYLPLYPTSSTIAADVLDCQPTNCDHANVLPFPDAGFYGALPGSNPACADFNGGAPCALVKGHDHLVGVANTHGDFNVAWTVKPVIFTHKAFGDGKINERITTLTQLWSLVASQDVVIAPDLVTFDCAVTSEQTYELGTPTVIPFP